MEPEAGFAYLDHVSDVRLRAWGRSLEETFTQACLGMWSLYSGASRVPDLNTWTVTVSGADYDELLVNLLNEMILTFDSEGLVAGRVQALSIHEAGDLHRVEAVLAGCKSSDLAGPPERYLKAATFHDLTVLPTRIDITLDI